jgi:hypothetical protein
MDAVVMKAIKKRPADRYQTIRELIGEIQYLATQALTASSKY